MDRAVINGNFDIVGELLKAGAGPWLPTSPGAARSLS